MHQMIPCTPGHDPKTSCSLPSVTLALLICFCFPVNQGVDREAVENDHWPLRRGQGGTCVYVSVQLVKSQDRPVTWDLQGRAPGWSWFASLR